MKSPAPKFIFCGCESFLNASVMPRIASGGPCSTWDQIELNRAASCVKFFSTDPETLLFTTAIFNYLYNKYTYKDPTFKQ